MKDFLDKITLVHGRFADLNAIWFPFIFLKPKTNTQKISPSRRFLMTLCFSWYAACFWPIKQFVFQVPIDKTLWIIFALKSFGFFAIWFRFVTSFLWNRRVKMIEEGTILEV